MVQNIESKSYMYSKKYLEIGTKKFNDNNFIEAISNFKQGIEELGDCYRSKKVLDDSENWILIAWIEEDKKRFQNAAKILKRTLSERIDLYEQNSERKC